MLDVVLVAVVVAAVAVDVAAQAALAVAFVCIRDYEVCALIIGTHVETH